MPQTKTRAPFFCFSSSGEQEEKKLKQKMKILKIDLNNPNPEIIKQAASVIEAGGIVVHPTDTAYGIAASVFDETAIKKVFDLKGRDFNKPLIVAIRDLTQIEELVEFNRKGKILFNKFFPGSLTIILPKKSIVPDIVTGGKPLGIRMPNCVVTLELSKYCKVPYTTTSANLSGKPALYSIEVILQQFNNETIQQCDLILDAGVLPETLPSTVIDVSTDEAKILRVGPISEAQITEALNLSSY